MNQKKTIAMICRPRHMNLGMSESNYRHKITGKGKSAKEGKKEQIRCHILCLQNIQTSLLARHLKNRDQVFCKPIQEIPNKYLKIQNDHTQSQYVTMAPTLVYAQYKTAQDKQQHEIICEDIISQSFIQI